MADYQLGQFEPDNAGIIQVFKSGGMQAALSAAASGLCGQANAAGHLHGPHGTLYRSGVDVLDRTAVGYVSTNGYLGAIDQKAHKTLDSLNH